MQREAMEFDVLIVVGGPAFLCQIAATEGVPAAVRRRSAQFKE